MISFYIVLAYLVVMSVVAALMYVSDKHKAVRHARRIPEKALLTVSFVGGAVGGFAAMQIVRHKTKAEHWYFTVVNVLGIAWQVAALVLLFIFKPF
jgi:uncharacterized membrane protein YsdA (DUF1294 family)